jgi:hypothetical protein
MNYLIFILGNPHRGARTGEGTRRGEPQSRAVSIAIPRNPSLS